METEQQMYEVPGRQLGWRVSQLQAQGLPYNVQSLGGGVYVIVVQQPVGAAPFAYQGGRARPAFSLGHYLPPAAIRVLLSVLLLVLVGWGLWVASAPSSATITVETGGMKIDPVTGRMVEDGGLWGWVAALRLPWDGSAQDAAQQQAQPPSAWRWPWDAAMEHAADTAESVQSTVTVVAGGVLAVLVLMIVLALVRRRG